MIFSHMERLSDKEISDTILIHLESVVQKSRNDPDFRIPELKQIIVTRWDSDPFFRGVYSYRNHESDLVTIDYKCLFLYYLALDVTANCICEIHCLPLDGFDLNTVHKLSSKEKKSGRNWDSNPGLLGKKPVICL